VLNGSKMWITSGAIADVVIATAKTDPAAGTRGISCFLVEKGYARLYPRQERAQDGFERIGNVGAVIRGVPGAGQQLAGQRGRRVQADVDHSGRREDQHRAMALGLAQAALDQATRYAKERKQFGQPIANFQALQWMIADMATEIDAARLLIYRAAAMKDAGQPFSKEAAMAKLFASETAERAAFKAAADPRRLWLQPRIPGRAHLPRPAAMQHRRGDERDPAPSHRPPGSGQVLAKSMRQTDARPSGAYSRDVFRDNPRAGPESRLWMPNSRLTVKSCYPLRISLV